MPRLLLVLALCAAAACVDDPALDTESTAAPAPLAGLDGAVDQADRACHVVLRDLARLANGTGGYQSSGTSWIWEGDVELSAAAVADGATAAEEADQMSEEERRMMAEWDAMAGADGGSTEAAQPDMDAMGGMDDMAAAMGGDGNTRILNQSEIDSLLGFDEDAGHGETSGVMAACECGFGEL